MCPAERSEASEAEGRNALKTDFGLRPRMLHYVQQDTLGLRFISSMHLKRIVFQKFWKINSQHFKRDFDFQ